MHRPEFYDPPKDAQREILEPWPQPTRPATIGPDQREDRQVSAVPAGAIAEAGPQDPKPPQRVYDEQKVEELTAAKQEELRLKIKSDLVRPNEAIYQLAKFDRTLQEAIKAEAKPENGVNLNQQALAQKASDPSFDEVKRFYDEQALEQLLDEKQQELTENREKTGIRSKELGPTSRDQGQSGREALSLEPGTRRPETRSERETKDAERSATHGKEMGDTKQARLERMLGAMGREPSPGRTHGGAGRGRSRSDDGRGM